MTVQALAPFSITTRFDRVHCLPWGLEGGLPGKGNGLELRTNGAWQQDLPSAKIYGVRVKRGDAYKKFSGGGGGFGDPFLREPDRVAFDLREGYVSSEAARALYGVVISEDGFADIAATEILRRR